MGCTAVLSRETAARQLTILKKWFYNRPKGDRHEQALGPHSHPSRNFLDSGLWQQHQQQQSAASIHHH
jgi:hypothetical protein